MKTMGGGIVALTALVAMGAADLQAQNVESIMRARERLELTDGQLEQLEVLRREAVERRTADMAEMEELRSQLEAGQVERGEVTALFRERRQERRALVQETRERVASVLTESQLEALTGLRLRRGERRAMGVRPGGRSGLDGPGFAPRGRAGLRGPQRPRRGPPRAAL